MFTLRLFLTVTVAAIAAAVVAPWVALIVLGAGFTFPFPRIFDRVVMVAAALFFWYEARPLDLARRLKQGFSKPRINWPAAATGAALGAGAMAVLWILAWFAGGAAVRPLLTAEMIAKYLAPAIVIALIEESFFRAILLHGMAEDFGAFPALILSSGVYAFTHLIHAPAHYVLRTAHPLAGFADLGASVVRMTHVVTAAPTLFGLFLLGLLLGESFLRTGTVYFAMGLHAAVVVGVKSWRKVVKDSLLPAWLTGYSGPPLIGGAAAWIIMAVLLVMIIPMTRRWASANEVGKNAIGQPS